MNYQNIMSIFGIVVGLAGFIYAVYQSREKAKLQNAICAQAWSLFAKANNATGSTQQALKAYKDTHLKDIDPNVLETLSKADAFNQEVFKDTIKNIHFSEPIFDNKTIKTWLFNRRITEKHAELFQIFVSTKNCASGK